MKPFALLLLVCFLPLRADILVNGNFADGRAHWRGDAQDVGASDGAELSGGSSTPSGVIIKLKKDKWCKIYQTFNIRDAKLFYSIQFKLSPDYKIASDQGEPTYSTPDFTDVPITWFGAWNMPENTWNLIVCSSEGFGTESSRYLRPDASKPSPQTMTGKLSGFTNGADGLLLIAFPPGEGSITLLNISLSSTDPNVEP